MNNQKNIIFLLVGLLFSGCTTSVQRDPAIHVLSEGVSEIAKAYESLAKIQAASESTYTVQDYNYDESRIPSQWLQEIELLSDYNGTVENFVIMVSFLAGLNEPRIDTRPRTESVPISIPKGSRKVISFLAEAGYQVGSAAVVSPVFRENLVVLTFNNGK